MEIEHVGRDELSDFYRKWMVVTFEDMARYFSDSPVSLRVAARDFFILGFQTFHDEYHSSRSEAERWLRSIKHTFMYGESYTEDAPDPDDILEEMEELGSWNENIYFAYLTMDEYEDLDNLPDLTDKQIKVYGRIMSRTYHSMLERHISFVSSVLESIPQTRSEEGALKNGAEDVESLRDGGLFVEAEALELLKRYDPDWEAIVSIMPGVTKIVY